MLPLANPGLATAPNPYATDDPIMLKKLLGLDKDDTFLEQASESARNALRIPVVQGLTALGDWLKDSEPRTVQRHIGLQTLCHVQAPINELVERGLQEMLNAHQNHTRLQLLTNTLLGFLNELLRIYGSALLRESPQLAKKSSSHPLLHQAIDSFIQLHGKRMTVKFAHHPSHEGFNWQDIYPYYQLALETRSHAVSRPMGYLLLLQRSLSPDLNGRQVLIAERIAFGLSPFVAVRSGFSNDTPFAAAMYERGAPTLMEGAPLVEEEEGKLYLGLTRASVELLALESHTTSQNQVPGKIDPHKQLNVAEVNAVIRHLKNRWSNRSLKRKAKRTKVEGELIIAYEYAAIRRLVAQQQAPADRRGNTVEITVESATLEDISPTGYGLSLKPNSLWAKVGALISIRRASDERWSLAIVRRALPRPGNRTHIGVELLSVDAESIRLVERNQSSVWEQVTQAATYSNHFGLFVPASPLNQQESRLLMPDKELKEGMAYATTQTSQGSLLLQVKSLVEIGVDFVMYQCEVRAIKPPEPPPPSR